MLNGSKAASVSAELDGSEKSLKGGLSPAQPGQKPLNWMALLFCAIGRIVLSANPGSIL